MRKPDAEIFEYVLRENDLAPEETLFLDDFPWNVEAARKVGINAVQITKENGIVDVLKV
jgi:putative hydrolase of the HAD superfamily